MANGGQIWNSRSVFRADLHRERAVCFMPASADKGARFTDNETPASVQSKCRLFERKSLHRSRDVIFVYQGQKHYRVDGVGSKER